MTTKKLRSRDGAEIMGIFRWKVVRPDGSIKSEGEQKNMVVLAGRSSIIENIFNAAPAEGVLVSHIAVGTGATPPADGDTDLETEVAREQLTSRATDGDEGSAATVFAAGSIPGLPLTVTEAVLLMEATDTPGTGTVLSRVATSIELDSLDALFIDWRLTLSDA